MLETCLAGGLVLGLPDATRARIDTGAATVARLTAGTDPVYGINTGFGKLAQTRIPADRLAELQRNLVRSHSAGVGAPLPDDVVRLVLLLKAASLAHGHSGVRAVLVERLLAMLAADALPVVPAQGSVGASGDLAPLAHLASTLIGEGELRIAGADPVPAAEGLARLGLAPLELAAKEGLALINGTQVSTALALVAWLRASRVFDAAVSAGALTVDVAKGSDTPFDDRIQRIRGHAGQVEVAARYRALLAGSPLRASHLDCAKVQDPYCLRCQPQVMGACADQMRHVGEQLLVEANGVTDNPLVFPDTGEALSGGNFHAEPVAFAADNLALAICEIGSLSERRTAMLMDPVLSGLPAFLIRDAGLNSGLMMAQVTSAALVSENKSLAWPASVDSIPTSANQEDHVSMATHGARRLLAMVDNCAAVVAIELIAGCQALEFHRPLASAAPLEALVTRVRAKVPALEVDRALAPDIRVLTAMILDVSRPLLPPCDAAP